MGNILEFGTHLLAAFAFTVPAASTVHADLPEVLRRIETGTVAPSFARYWVDVIDGDLITGTSAPLAIADPIQVDRPTTAREELIGELRTWMSLGENWDGEGAVSGGVKLW